MELRILLSDFELSGLNIATPMTPKASLALARAVPIRNDLSGGQFLIECNDAEGREFLQHATSSYPSAARRVLEAFQRAEFDAMEER